MRLLPALTAARFNELTDIIGLALLGGLVALLMHLDLRSARRLPIRRAEVALAVITMLVLVAVVAARFERLAS